MRTPNLPPFKKLIWLAWACIWVPIHRRFSPIKSNGPPRPKCDACHEPYGDAAHELAFRKADGSIGGSWMCPACACEAHYSTVNLLFHHLFIRHRTKGWIVGGYHRPPTVAAIILMLIARSL